MQKGAYLELTLRTPAPAAGGIQSLAQSRLAGTHDGLTVHVLHAAPDSADPTAHQVVLYVEGDQPAPDDFVKLATDVVQRQWAGGGAPAAAAALTAAPAASPAQLERVEEWEDYDDAPRTIPSMPNALVAAAAPVTAAASSGCFAQVTGAAPAAAGAAPTGTPVAAPGSGAYDSCPAQGDGGDQATSTMKNRDDMPDPSAWIQTTVSGILQLPVPERLPRRRDEWTADQQAAVAQVEGLPLQVVGYLAGVRQEAPESCNCHIVGDLDDHLWVVDQQGTDRRQSVVAEITPRIRAQHAAWTVPNLCNLVTSGTRVRISGWLMMDPEHPDQVAGTAAHPPTRGTTWEIHPILALDVDDGSGNFVPLDTAAGGGNGGGNGGAGGGDGGGSGGNGGGGGGGSGNGGSPAGGG